MDLSQNLIAVVDDDSDILLSARLFLKKYFQEIHCFSHPSDLLEQLKEVNFAAVLLDLNYQNGRNDGQEGLAALESIKSAQPKTEVIMMTAYAEVNLAVEAVKKGAFDFIVKPWQNEKLLVTLMNAVQKRNMNQQLSQQAAVIYASTKELHPLLGDSAGMQQIRELIHQVAPTNASVFIKGETGSGKSLIAQHIHQRSKLAKQPFIAVDFSTLKEAEQLDVLLGTNESTGKWSLALGGTLYLKEVGLLSGKAQEQLLEVMQDDNIPRLISSSKETLTQQNFKKELLYRINTIEVNCTSIRERKEDLPELFDFFLDRFKSLHRKSALMIPPFLIEQLKQYDWPGNVRELNRAVERAVVISNESIQLENLIPSLPSNSSDKENLKLEELEKQHVNSVLLKYSGNIQKSAAALGISRAALYRRIEKYQLEL